MPHFEMLIEEIEVEDPCEHCAYGTSTYYLHFADDDDDDEMGPLHLEQHFRCQTYDDRRTLFRGSFEGLKNALEDVDIPKREKNRLRNAAFAALNDPCFQEENN